MIRNIRIGLRSAVAFSILGLITLILGIFAITRLSALNNATDIMSEHRLPAAIKVGDMRGALLYTRLAVVTLFDAETRADTERYTNLINTRFTAYQKVEQEMAGYVVAEQGRRHSHIQTLSAEYKDQLNQLIKLFEQGQQEQALALRW